MKKFLFNTKSQVQQQWHNRSRELFSVEISGRQKMGGKCIIKWNSGDTLKYCD